MRRDRLRGILILIGLAASGCYVPEPADPVALAPGSELTLELSANGRDRLHQVAARDDEELSGQLVSVTADSLTVSTRLLGAGSSPWVNGSLRQPVSFARSDVESVTIPRLHRGRTLATVGLIAAATATLVVALFDINGSGTGPDGPPPPPPSPFGPIAR